MAQAFVGAGRRQIGGYAPGEGFRRLDVNGVVEERQRLEREIKRLRHELQEAVGALPHLRQMVQYSGDLLILAGPGGCILEANTRLAEVLAVPQQALYGQPLQRWLLGPGQMAPPTGFHAAMPLVGWPEALMALAAEGLQRLVLLGGAELAGALLQERLVDELQLTLCPLLLGGPHSWLPLQEACAGSHWRLQETRQLGGDELMLRYARHGP